MDEVVVEGEEEEEEEEVDRENFVMGSKCTASPSLIFLYLSHAKLHTGMFVYRRM